MDNKNKFWKGALVGALVTVFAELIIVGMSMGIFLVGKPFINNQVEVQADQPGVAQSGELDFDRIQSKVEFLQKVISEYYLFDEDVSKVEDGIYAGMMAGLGDPYTVYYTADEYAELRETTEGKYCGIGAMISQDRVTGVMTVFKVFKDSPSYEAGLLPGDLLYKVGDTEVTGMDLDLVVKNYIKGEENTDVTLTVLRPQLSDYVDLTMTRRQIEVPTVEYEMLENNVGYIAISQFDTVTADQFKSAIDDLQEQGMEKMVVDLRSNPGGVLDSAVSMLDYVLPNGLLVYTQDKNGKGDKYYSKDGHQVDLPMAVLINGDSASASEVFSGAVKDFEWGTLVGTTTFGKGIVQNVIPLGEDGTAVKITTSHYFTPSGYDLHGKGIEPDVAVELNESLRTKAVIDKSEDNQLQKALEVLEGME